MEDLNEQRGIKNEIKKDYWKKKREKQEIKMENELVITNFIHKKCN